MQHHTGNYSFTCQVCQTGFTRKKPFEDHMRKHEGHFYRCEYCDKAFQSFPGFKHHVRTHTKKYPFSCYVCMIGFNLRSELKIHENEHHQNEHSGAQHNHSICLDQMWQNIVG